MIDNSTKDKLENENPHFGNTLLCAVIDWDDVGATHQYFYEAQREEAEAFWLSVKSELNAL